MFIMIHMKYPIYKIPTVLHSEVTIYLLTRTSFIQRRQGKRFMLKYNLNKKHDKRI